MHVPQRRKMYVVYFLSHIIIFPMSWSDNDDRTQNSCFLFSCVFAHDNLFHAFIFGLSWPDDVRCRKHIFFSISLFKFIYAPNSVLAKTNNDDNKILSMPKYGMTMEIQANNLLVKINCNVIDNCWFKLLFGVIVKWLWGATFFFLFPLISTATPIIFIWNRKKKGIIFNW